MSLQVRERERERARERERETLPQKHYSPSNLSEAGGVDGLSVIGLAVVEVVTVQSAPGDTHRLGSLVILLQPTNIPIIFLESVF